MTDAEYEKEKQRIKKLADLWVKPIGLGWWRIDLAYNRDGLDTENSRASDISECAARTHVDWMYMQATITFNLQSTQGMDDDRLEYCFVHELMHIFLNEMRMWGTERMESEKHNEAIQHEERVATTLANGFIWLKEHLREGKG